MIKAIIIDDETPCIESLYLDIKKYCPEIEVVAKCPGAKDGLLAIKKYNPDLVFLDIEMPWMNGFELIEALEVVNFNIIFTTAYDKFAVRAFRISAIDYLLKPIGRDDLIAAVSKLLKKEEGGIESDHLEVLLQNVHQPNKPNRIALSTKEGLNFVEIDNIIYCEADGNYTVIYLEGGIKNLLTKPLKEVQNQLDDMDFCRIHNSFLINLNKIKRYVRGDGGYVIMNNDANLSVSRTKKEDLLNRIQAI